MRAITIYNSDDCIYLIVSLSVERKGKGEEGRREGEERSGGW
jgi:hypothetical protein